MPDLRHHRAGRPCGRPPPGGLERGGGGRMRARLRHGTIGRTLLGLGLLLALATAAACGGGGEKTNGLEKLPAAEVGSRTLSALRSAPGVHVVGTEKDPSSDSPARYDLVMSATTTRGTIEEYGQQTQLVKIANDTYVRRGRRHRPARRRRQVQLLHPRPAQRLPRQLPHRARRGGAAGEGRRRPGGAGGGARRHRLPRRERRPRLPPADHPSRAAPPTRWTSATTVPPPPSPHPAPPSTCPAWADTRPTRAERVSPAYSGS